MSLATNVLSLATRMATECKSLRTLINGNAADLSSLTTTAKGNLVAAINEVNGNVSAPPTATMSTAGLIEIATLAEVATGTDAVRAVTPHGVRQERLAVKAEILGAAGAAQDTLEELKAYIDALDTADETQIQGVITALAARVRTDTAAQGLNATQQGNARTNIAAAGAVDMGDPTTDFVAAFNAGLV